MENVEIIIMSDRVGLGGVWPFRLVCASCSGPAWVFDVARQGETAAEAIGTRLGYIRLGSLLLLRVLRQYGDAIASDQALGSPLRLRCCLFVVPFHEFD